MPDERAWALNQEFHKETEMLKRILEIFGDSPFTIEQLKDRGIIPQGTRVMEAIEGLSDRGRIKPKTINGKRHYIIVVK